MASMRCAGVVKYASNGRPLTVITPGAGTQPGAGDGLLAAAGGLGERGGGHGVVPPGQRALAADRSSGSGDCAACGWSGPAYTFSFVEHLAAERALRQHALDRAADGLGRLAGEQLAVRLRLDAARVAAVAVHPLAIGLAGGQHDLLGVDDDDVVAGVEVGSEDRLVLAAQHAGDLGGHAPEHEAVGVDDVPLAGDLAGFRGCRCASLRSTFEREPGDFDRGPGKATGVPTVGNARRPDPSAQR